MQSEPTKIDIFRHGEHRLGDVICGVTDPELTPTGWKQLERQTFRLISSGVKWDICISSPLKRCAQFSKALTHRWEIDLKIDERLAEVNFGDWETLSFNQITARFPGEWQKWIASSDRFTPHGGEIYEEFLRRVGGAFEEIVCAHKGKNIALFVHGGVIRAIFHRILGLKRTSLSNIHIPHACHSRIVAYHSAGQPDWFQLDSHSG